MMLPRTPVYGKKSVLHPPAAIDLLRFTDFLQKSAFSQSGKKIATYAAAILLHRQTRKAARRR